jgi:hypothetical protein
MWVLEATQQPQRQTLHWAALALQAPAGTHAVAVDAAAAATAAVATHALL